MIATSLSLDTTLRVHAPGEAANSSPLANWLATRPGHARISASTGPSAVLLDPTTSTRTFQSGSDLLTISPSARLHEIVTHVRAAKNARLAHEQSFVSDRPGSHGGRPGLAVGIGIPDGIPIMVGTPVLVHGFAPPVPPRRTFQKRNLRRRRARARKRVEESSAGCSSAAPADQCRCSHASSDGIAAIAHWTVKDLSGRCFDLPFLSSERVPSLQEISTSIGIPRDAFKTMVIHDRTITLIYDLRGGAGPAGSDSPGSQPTAVSTPVAPPTMPPQLMSTTSQLGGKRKAALSVGQAKVATAKKRILNHHYGQFTLDNNRVREATSDLKLSGKQQTQLRAELNVERERLCVKGGEGPIRNSVLSSAATDAATTASSPRPPGDPTDPATWYSRPKRRFSAKLPTWNPITGRPVKAFSKERGRPKRETLGKVWIDWAGEWVDPSDPRAHPDFVDPAALREMEIRQEKEQQRLAKLQAQDVTPHERPAKPSAPVPPPVSEYRARHDDYLQNLHYGPLVRSDASGVPPTHLERALKRVGKHEDQPRLSALNARRIELYEYKLEEMDLVLCKNCSRLRLVDTAPPSKTVCQ